MSTYTTEDKLAFVDSLDCLAKAVSAATGEDCSEYACWAEAD